MDQPVLSPAEPKTMFLWMRSVWRTAVSHSHMIPLQGTYIWTNASTGNWSSLFVFIRAASERYDLPARSGSAKAGNVTDIFFSILLESSVRHEQPACWILLSHRRRSPKTLSLQNPTTWHQTTPRPMHHRCNGSTGKPHASSYIRQHL